MHDRSRIHMTHRIYQFFDDNNPTLMCWTGKSHIRFQPFNKSFRNYCERMKNDSQNAELHDYVGVILEERIQSTNMRLQNREIAEQY